MKKESFINYIIGAIIIVLGVFIIARKETFLTIVMIAAGILAIISGINDIRVLNFIKTQGLSAFLSNSSVIKVVGNIIVGTLCIVMPLVFATTVISVVVYIIAAYLLLSGILALIQSRYFKSDDDQTKKFKSNLVAQGIIFILISIFFFVTPMDVAYAVINIIGIAVMLFGAGIIGFTIKANKSVQAIETTYTDSTEKK